MKDLLGMIMMSLFLYGVFEAFACAYDKETQIAKERNEQNLPLYGDNNEK